VEKEGKAEPNREGYMSFPDEKGVASITALLDHLRFENNQSPFDHLDEVQKGLQTCWRLGYLYIELQNAGRRRFITVSDWKTLSLSDLVHWDDAEERWKIRQQELSVDEVLIRLTQGAVRDLKLYQDQVATSDE